MAATLVAVASNVHALKLNAASSPSVPARASSKACAVRPSHRSGRRSRVESVDGGFLGQTLTTVPVRASTSATATTTRASADGAVKAKKGGAVVTGGAAGVGFGMAEEFLVNGYDVVICDINGDKVQAAGEYLGKKYPSQRIFSIRCDIGDENDVQALADLAREKLEPAGGVRIWVNNAGINGGKVPVRKQTVANIRRVVNTNLTGTILTTRAAINTMLDAAKEFVAKNPGQVAPRGHIFVVTGSGVKGEPTPGWATYGATKRGLPQLVASLNKELSEEKPDTESAVAAPNWKPSDVVAVHTMSPGMVFTDLLLEDSTPRLRQFFDILADEPDVVARDLVPQMCALVEANAAPGAKVEYLSPPRIASRMLSLDMVKFLIGIGPQKHFDAKGNRISKGEKYKDNGVKVLY
eukprot:jgi/Mesvir1/22659/Mv14093-RA.1